MPDYSKLYGPSSLDFESPLPKIIQEKIEEIQREQCIQYEKEILGIKSPSEFFRTPWETYTYAPYPVCDISLKDLEKTFKKETKKMEAKKCDRCGKLYETENAKDALDILFKQEKISEADKERYSDFYNDEMRTHGILIKRTNCGEIVDFCPECRESFKKWFESGASTKKEK